MAKEVKILDLPTAVVEPQDYMLVVQPDGTHNKSLVQDLVDQVTVEVETGGAIGEAVALAQQAADTAVAAALSLTYNNTVGF